MGMEKKGKNVVSRVSWKKQKKKEKEKKNNN
jgi:hypothetical protein